MAGNPWQVQQAAEELNAFFTDVDNAAVLSDANDLLWSYIYTAVKQAAVGVDVDTPLSFEMWRVSYNDNSAAGEDLDNRTIPPGTGTNSAMRTAAEALSDFNNASPNPLSLHGVSQPLSGSQKLAVADYFYLQGVSNAKTQGWYDVFKNIWDGAMEQASLQVAAAMLNPAYDEVADNTVPLQQLSATAQLAAWRGRTSVVLGASPNRYVIYLGGSGSSMTSAPPGFAVSTSLVRIGSGTPQAGYAIIDGSMMQYLEGSGALAPLSASAIGNGTVVRQASVVALQPASAAVTCSVSIVRALSGAIAPQAPTVAVSVDRIRDATGVLIASPATTSGSSDLLFAALNIVNGSPQASPAAVSATGTLIRNGQGGPIASGATTSGSVSVS